MIQFVPRLIIFWVVCFFVLANFAGASEPIRYFSVIRDLPIPPGYAELPDSAVSFEQGGFRLAETAATATQADVPPPLAFYAETLPQLGWRTDGPAAWRREGERLNIQWHNNRLDVRLEPAEGP